MLLELDGCIGASETSLACVVCCFTEGGFALFIGEPANNLPGVRGVLVKVSELVVGIELCLSLFNVLSKLEIFKI